MTTRRDFLIQVAAATGIAATPLPAAIAEILEDAAQRADFKALDHARADFLRQLADIIIPATDTGSASEAGVVMFIDGMLADWYSAEESRDYLEGLEVCRTQAGEVLSGDYVSQLDRTSFSDETADSNLKRFYLTTKELVLIGYFTSREGMQNNLHTYGPMGHLSYGPSGPPGSGISY